MHKNITTPIRMTSSIKNHLAIDFDLCCKESLFRTPQNWIYILLLWIYSALRNDVYVNLCNPQLYPWKEMDSTPPTCTQSLEGFRFPSGNFDPSFPLAQEPIAGRISNTACLLLLILHLRWKSSVQTKLTRVGRTLLRSNQLHDIDTYSI